MHELSIAQSLIDIAENTARVENCGRIQAIKIRLGEFTTIVREALEFAFEIARIGTMAENARLQIESIPMEVECVLCGPGVVPLRAICLLCPRCGLPVKIVSGEELQVEYVDFESKTEGVAWNA
jgi:hydrogenase nickel incorporation protein HypA/HybF